MRAIIDKNGKTIAYLYLNIILDQQQEKVLGILLGNCLFGQQKLPIGKFFNDTFRKTTGKIIGKLDKKTSSAKPNQQSDILLAAWKLLHGVKDHTCAWIDEKDSWSKKGFEEYLSAK